MDKDEIYILTGATGSIGKEIAHSIAKDGYKVILACRNVTKAKELAERIKSETRNNNIEVAELKLDDLKSVRQFADEIMNSGIVVKALINNAGVMARTHSVTKDGYEEDYQVNFISPALLTQLLIPRFSTDGIVIFTTSITRKYCSIPIEFPDERHFSQLGTYSRSKRAITMYAIHLAEELKDTGIRINCADPGVVDSSMIHLDRWFDSLSDIFFRPFISSPTQGALSILRALNSQETRMVFNQKGRIPAYKGLKRMKNYNKVIETALKK